MRTESATKKRNLLERKSGFVRADGSLPSRDNDELTSEISNEANDENGNLKRKCFPSPHSD
jgi:hypothetical protein